MKIHSIIFAILLLPYMLFGSDEEQNNNYALVKLRIGSVTGRPGTLCFMPRKNFLEKLNKFKVQIEDYPDMDITCNGKPSTKYYSPDGGQNKYKLPEWKPQNSTVYENLYKLVNNYH